MDVIREFVLKGRMEIVKSDLAVPDITAFTKQLEAQNKLAQDQARAFDELLGQQQKRDQQAREEAQAEKQRRDAEAKAREERKKAAEEAKRQKEEAARLEREAAEAAKKAADEAAKAEKEKQDAIDATNKAREEAVQREREISDQLLKGGDALKTAGDGAFAFARGLTLVGLEGDASLERVARSVASVQAKFDLFRGSVDLLKGSIESVRAFQQSIDLAGGAVALLTTRVSALARFLGPTGLVVAGALAAGAAVVGVFRYMQEDAEKYIQDIEQRLREFVANSQREAATARAAFEREDAIRATLAGQQKIDSIRSDLAGVGEAASVSDIKAAASEQLKDLLGNLTEITDEQFRARRDEIVQGQLTAFDASEENLRRRQQLGRELLNATSQRDDGANRERESAIDEAERREKETRANIARRQDELRRAEEQQAESQRRQAAERAKLNQSDRAFVERASGDIRGATIADLERLQQLAPASFGQDVTDELVRRGGGTVAERTDPVADLTAEIASLREALVQQTGKRKGLESADAALDAEAEAGVEKIRSLLRGLARDIEQIEIERAKTESYIQQATP